MIFPLSPPDYYRCTNSLFFFCARTHCVTKNCFRWRGGRRVPVRGGQRAGHGCRRQPQPRDPAPQQQAQEDAQHVARGSLFCWNIESNLEHPKN